MRVISCSVKQTFNFIFLPFLSPVDSLCPLFRFNTGVIWYVHIFLSKVDPILVSQITFGIILQCEGKMSKHCNFSLSFTKEKHESQIRDVTWPKWHGWLTGIRRGPRVPGSLPGILWNWGCRIWKKPSFNSFFQLILNKAAVSQEWFYRNRVA